MTVQITPPVGYIPEYTADPLAPYTDTAWVLKGGSIGAGGGKAKVFLGFWVTTPNTPNTSTYQLSYETTEHTIKRATLS